MINYKHPICFLVAFMFAVVFAGFASAAKKSSTVRIATGNVTSFAVGNNAQAAINIGGLPPQSADGCANVEVRHGDIKRIAIGPNANATVNLPGHPTPCEEEQK